MVMAAIYKNGGMITTNHLADKLGVSWLTAFRILEEMSVDSSSPLVRRSYRKNRYEVGQYEVNDSLSRFATGD